MTDTSSRLIEALHTAASTELGRDAGAALAAVGWAVFPVPVAHPREGCGVCPPYKPECTGKFDTGVGALCHINGSADVRTWIENAVQVMRRHRVEDVNVAVVPWRCAVPLIGIDLDGGEAVDEFPGLPRGALHVDSGRADRGRHVYLSGAPEPITGLHMWGGEIRSDRGHLMLPPSLVGGRRDYYTPVGERFASVHDDEMDGVLDGITATSSGAGAASLPDGEAWEAVLTLSRRPAERWAVAKLDEYLDALRMAGAGDRHARMKSAVGCAVACAARGGLPLRWALEQVVEVFAGTIWAERDRNAEREVNAVVAWTLAQQRERVDEMVPDELVAWARETTEGSKGTA